MRFLANKKIIVIAVLALLLLPIFFQEGFPRIIFLSSFNPFKVLNIHASESKYLIVDGKWMGEVFGESPYYVDIPQKKMIYFEVGNWSNPQDSKLFFYSLSERKFTQIDAHLYVLGPSIGGASNQSARVYKVEDNIITLDEGNPAELINRIAFDVKNAKIISKIKIMSEECEFYSELKYSIRTSYFFENSQKNLWASFDMTNNTGKIIKILGVIDSQKHTIEPSRAVWEYKNSSGKWIQIKNLDAKSESASYAEYTNDHFSLDRYDIRLSMEPFKDQPKGTKLRVIMDGYVSVPFEIRDEYLPGYTPFTRIQ